jgi:hypothetical protein
MLAKTLRDFFKRINSFAADSLKIVDSILPLFKAINLLMSIGP